MGKTFKKHITKNIRSKIASEKKSKALYEDTKISAVATEEKVGGDVDDTAMQLGHFVKSRYTKLF